MFVGPWNGRSQWEVCDVTDQRKEEVMGVNLKCIRSKNGHNSRNHWEDTVNIPVYRMVSFP